MNTRTSRQPIRQAIGILERMMGRDAGMDPADQEDIDAAMVLLRAALAGKPDEPVLDGTACPECRANLLTICPACDYVWHHEDGPLPGTHGNIVADAT